MVPRPATMPVTAPKAEALPWFRRSSSIHVAAPAAAEMCVTSMAMPAAPLAANALPPLKPNQPTQSMPAPIIDSVILCGGMA